jgi:hypothetical protein
VKPKFFHTAEDFRRWLQTRRARTLAAQGRMAQAGLAALAARTPSRSGRYSYETRPADLVAPYSGMLDANTAARFNVRRPRTGAQRPGGS